MASSRERRSICIYCGQRAGSTEHIIATRFIEILREDPRGLPLPPTLTVWTNDIARRRIGGKRTKKGAYTLEYTTRVCESCNGSWMNDMDTAAYKHLAKMIRGQTATLGRDAQSALAGWISKVAVTARAAPHSRLPIDEAWTDWLYQHHSAPPTWAAWVGRYEGAQPFWYHSDDIRVELAPPRPALVIHKNGILATLAIGHVVLQVFGVTGGGGIVGPDELGVLPRIWPVEAVPPVVNWPPPQHLIDAVLPAWATRFLP